MARMYFDEHSDLTYLAGQTICIVGYGNQGRSQALNMRDSGLSVIVGSRRDASYQTALQDGFAVFGVDEAVTRSDVIFLLVPDEVMPQVFQQDVAPNLASGNMLVFASGYNITFGLIKDPLRRRRGFDRSPNDRRRSQGHLLSGEGFPSLIAVHHSATETAFERMLALCEGIGSTRMGVIESSFSGGDDRGPIRRAGGLSLRGASLLRSAGGGRVQSRGGHAGILCLG